MDHKIAIIGFGGMGSYHVSLQRNAGNFILSGIWDIKEERREAAGVRVHQGTTSQGWRQARTAAGGHRAGNRELSFLLLHLKC